MKNLGELKNKIKNVFNKFTPKNSKFSKAVSLKLSELWSGNGKLNEILYIWGVLPGILVLLLQRRIESFSFLFISKIICLFLMIYFLWHFLVIKRTLKAQPNLIVKKIKQKDLFEGKTKEEISEIKKQIGKDRLKKALLLKAWDTTPIYVIVYLLDLLIALTQLQAILK